MSTINKASVLILDDDDKNIFALKAVLTASGFFCHTATSANEAFKILNKEAITTVLVDMMMPDMDGYEFLKIVKNEAAYSAVKFIAVTAQAMPGDKEKIMEAGADEYVSKPVDIDILLQKINVDYN